LVDPEKLMTLLGETEGSSFSPAGILRINVVAGDDPIMIAIRTLETIRK